MARLILEWNEPLKEFDYCLGKEVISDFSKKHIDLSIGIKGKTLEECEILHEKLKDSYNAMFAQSKYDTIEYAYCPTDYSPNYTDGDWEYYDSCCFNRDYGYVAEQKRNIIKNLRKVWKTLDK